MTGKTLAIVLALAIITLGALAVGGSRAAAAAAEKDAAPRARGIGRVVKSDEEWKRILTPEQYRVLRRQGTEPAFTGRYWNQHARGIYRCAGCGLELFASDTKFDSGTGWPSFWAPIAPGRVGEHTDTSLGIPRTEVVCNRCGGHLGHVFDDGPAPTHLRYCINSAALSFSATR